MKKSQQQQQQPVVMDATGKGTFDATGKGAFLGTLDTSWMDKNVSMRNKESLNPNGGALFSGDPARRAKEERDLAAAHAANQKQGIPADEPAHVDEIPDTVVMEHLNSLFSGENLSEEFMNKTAVIFEAVLNERTTKIREQVLRESASIIQEEVEKVTQELATRLDEYLNYAVDEWMKENKLAVENGIRTEISESFIGGLKNLFETHYIEVPEKKHDILEDLFNENQELESALNEQIQTNMNLSREVTAGQARAVFLNTVSDMSQVDAERLASLAESIDFSNAQDFQNKLLILKENYLKAAPVVAQETETLTEQWNAPAVTEGPMSVYVNALSRQSKSY
jgi:plasmid maintenance system antidote protein VapI